MHQKPSTAMLHEHFPLPGERILRSVLAVWCCIAIYLLRGKHGAPFYSLIAALQCIQPYTANMLKVGGNRIRGTLVGAFWGTILLLLELSVAGWQFEENLVHYGLLVLFVGTVLYSTVLLGITDSSYFSTVVFLSISINHIGDANPWIFVLNRTLDTTIGVCVAIAVCAVHLPRLRDTDTLFVSGVDHVLFREDRQLSPFSKVAINRFLQDGMQYSVSTRQTPATVRELLSGVNLKLPIIAMDGAVLYDLGSRRYLVTKKMDADTAARATAFLHGKNMPFFVNTVEDDLLVIYYMDPRVVQPDEAAHAAMPQSSQEPHSDRSPGARGGSAGHAGPGLPGAAPAAGRPEPILPETPEADAVSRSALEAMHRLYLRKNVSPYRNYVHADRDVTENVLYLLVIDRTEQVEALCAAMREEPWFSRCRAALDTFDCGEGETILRIYMAGATRAAMLKHLQAYVGADKTVTFGNVPGECDVLISDAGDSHMVRELRRRFEPVSLRGWRNILRL